MMGDFYSSLIMIVNCIKDSSNENGIYFYEQPAEANLQENLAPVLFALFLNDLEDFMKARSCPGISLEFVLEYLYFYLKLLVLL